MFCASLLSVPYLHAEVDSSLWQTKKYQHFIIYYQEAQDSYVEDLADAAEKYYNDIVEDLGYRRFDFWSWDNRAKIYLFKDAEGYHADTKRDTWSGAEVNVRNRTIKTFIGQKNFFDSILPHEMTHIIFREFIGERTLLPLWVDEGVACSQEKTYLAARIREAKSLLTQGSYVKLKDFSGLTASSLDNPPAFYAQAASIMVYLIEYSGKDKFLDFSRQLRDGTNWQEALKNIYGFANFEDMEQKWREYTLEN